MTSAVLYALAALIAVVLYQLGPFIWRAFTSPLRHLPGPPTDSWWLGQFRIINAAENSVPQEEWAKQYGPSIAYRGMFGVSLLAVHLLRERLSDCVMVGVATVDDGH